VLLGGYQAVRAVRDGYLEHVAALLAGRRLRQVWSIQVVIEATDEQA
jgi:hypothetical protein